MNQFVRRVVTGRRVLVFSALLVVSRLFWTLRSPAVEESCTNGSYGGLDTIQAPAVNIRGGLDADGETFRLEDEPFRIFSGEFHYFRTQPADWRDRLLKMKAAGLNTVSTYIPWNLHEPAKGDFRFKGRWNIVEFISEAQKVGLLVIVRPGPYICAEWEFGGLPAWLLRDPELTVRTSYPSFMYHVEEYFAQLFQILAPLTYRRGGPIIAFQVENEYGSFHVHDKVYMNFLVNQFKKWRLEELLFTSDGSDKLVNGTIPGIFATVNFKKNQQTHLDKLRAFQPNKPLMVAEFWTGWFDHWSHKHYNTTTAELKTAVSNILETGASINFYMFVGGTNFEFWNGANWDETKNKYLPTTTSYDYDAPISEDGTLKKEFYIIRKLISQYSKNPLPATGIPANIEKAAYGSLSVESWIPYQTLMTLAQDFIQHKYDDDIAREFPVSMEFVESENGYTPNYGFLLYRTEISTENAQTIAVDGEIGDRAQVLLNYRQIHTWYRNKPVQPVTLPIVPHLADGSSYLDIFVENMGRINFKKLDSEYKGLIGSVTLDEEHLTGWTHIPLDLEEEFIRMLVHQDKWLNPQPDQVFACPAMFKVVLDLDGPPRDTFLDMVGWTKGVVVVNGFTLGRYWRVGPQRTLYLPGALLAQGRNVILVLELHKPHTSITLGKEHLLNHSW